MGGKEKAEKIETIFGKFGHLSKLNYRKQKTSNFDIRKLRFVLRNLVEAIGKKPSGYGSHDHVSLWL
jgi:hypothetical protein